MRVGADDEQFLRPIAFDPERCRQRSTVEHGFRKVKTWRALATRYGTTPGKSRGRALPPRLGHMAEAPHLNHMVKTLSGP
ncbi:hypothetical protein GCM10018953_46870 [Streptosporangium nondiastaticum]